MVNLDLLCPILYPLASKDDDGKQSIAQSPLGLTVQKDGEAAAQADLAKQTDRLNAEREQRKADRRLQAVLREKPKARKQFRTLSKLAQASPAIVRSEAEQLAHCRMCATRLPELVELRKQCDRSTVDGRIRSADITAEMRELSVPMFLVRMEGYAMFVSANVLSDYKREGLDVEVLAMPVLQRSRHYDIRRSLVDMGYIADAREARSNGHAMGMAQNAWRYAHQEGDVAAEAAAFRWLYHGQFVKPCKDLECKVCKGMNHRMRELQSRETLKLAFRYLELNRPDSSGFHGSRIAHKAKQPKELFLRFAFASGFLRHEPQNAEAE